jgi:drug/metabolite transporter (DMT)-like permease
MTSQPRHEAALAAATVSGPGRHSWWRSSHHAALMLVAVTIGWGLGFPLVKNWQEASAQCPGGVVLASMTVIALRMLLALAILAAFQPGLFWKPSRRARRAGLLLGSMFFLGFGLQVVGAADTSPALSAFFTSVSSAIVPVLTFVCFRVSAPRLTLIGLGVGIAGVLVLGMKDQGSWSIGWGDGLTLLAAVVFGVQIVVLDRLGRTVEPSHLTVPCLAMAGVLALGGACSIAAWDYGIGSWLSWTGTMLQDPGVLRDLVLMTVFSSVLAFHWMNVYQPRVAASRAALIYLLEPVFASLFSLLWQHDRLTYFLVIGGGLILAGNLLVELPGLLRSETGALATGPASTRR